MPRRYYSSTAQGTTLSSAVNSSVTTLVVAAVSGWPSSFPYTLVLDQDTINEELVEVTARSGTTLTVTRGVDGVSAKAHDAGASVNHGVSARDFDEPNAFINGTSVVTTSMVADSAITTAKIAADIALTRPVLTSPEEVVTISATAATGTVAFDARTSGVVLYTSNASANWTLNVRGDGSNTLNSMLSTGTSITIAFLVTNGSTAYYQTGFQLDGSTQTVRWQGGSAPTSGNANSVDAYTFTIIKTAATPTYTVLGQQTRFA